MTTVRCPHGDPFCPCQDGDSCHYENGEGYDAWICPNPPLGFQGVTLPHCHTEGCEWHYTGCSTPEVVGICGLLKLHPSETVFRLAKPGSREWGCGWLRQPMGSPMSSPGGDTGGDSWR